LIKILTWQKRQKKNTPKYSPNDEQLLVSAYTDNIIDYTTTGTQALTALSCHPKFTEFIDKYTLKQIQNAMARIKANAATPEDLYTQQRQRLQSRHLITEQFGKFSCFLISFLHKSNISYLVSAIFSELHVLITGMPVAVSGLQPKNTATNAALRRLTEFSGRGGTARMPSTGASVAGPKSTVSVPTSTVPNAAKAVGMVKSAYVTPVGAGGFTAMANGMAVGAVPRGQYKGILDLEEEEEEMVVEPKEAVTEDMKTDWGTPVASSPSHCINPLHDPNPPPGN
jgi:hypothetical protein